MLYIILDTENLAQKNERSYKKTLELSQGSGVVEEELVYFFDARLFLNCIEKYYDTKYSKVVLVDRTGGITLFDPAEREKAILKIQKDSESTLFAKDLPVISRVVEKQASIIEKVSEYSQAIQNVLSIREMKYSAIPAPFERLSRLLGDGEVDNNMQIAVCTSSITEALLRLLSACPQAALWTWNRGEQTRPQRTLDERRIEFDNLVFNTGIVISSLNPKKDKIPSESIVVTIWNMQGSPGSFLHMLSKKLLGLSFSVMRYLLNEGSDQEEKPPTMRVLLTLGGETNKEKATKVYETLLASLQTERDDLEAPNRIKVAWWHDYKVRKREGSESSLKSVSSDGKRSKGMESSDSSTNNSSRGRGRASSFEVNPRAKIPRDTLPGVSTRLLQKSTSEGESTTEVLTRRKSQDATKSAWGSIFPIQDPVITSVWETQNSRYGRNRDYSTGPMPRKPRTSVSPVKVSHSSNTRGRVERENSPEDSSASMAEQTIIIASREEINEFLREEGFKHVSLKKKRQSTPQARCRLKLYCGKQRAGVNCGYYHPREELQKLHTDRGLIPRKIYLCKNESCRFSSEPEKCNYAHSDEELLCTFCERKGHHYAECPVVESQNRL